MFLKLLIKFTIGLAWAIGAFVGCLVAEAVSKHLMRALSAVPKIIAPKRLLVLAKR